MKYLLPKPVVDTFSLEKMQKRTSFYSRMPSRSFCGLGLFLGAGAALPLCLPELEEAIMQESAGIRVGMGLAGSSTSQDFQLLLITL